jgi:hypothetical protein
MRRLLTLCCLLALSCATVPPTPDTYTCATACARGAELDCDWARWNPDVGNCASQCVDWRDTWGYDVACMSKVATCEAAEHCQGHTYGVHRLSKK